MRRIAARPSDHSAPSARVIKSAKSSSHEESLVRPFGSEPNKAPDPVQRRDPQQHLAQGEDVTRRPVKRRIPEVRVEGRVADPAERMLEEIRHEPWVAGIAHRLAKARE